MVTLEPDAEQTVRARARVSLIRSTMIGAIVAGIPLFVVLYWLSIEQGSWQRVLLANGIYILFFAILAWRHSRIFVTVTPETITKQTLLNSTVVKRADVAALHLADLHQTSAPELLPQLVALDSNGRRLFRMRGTFWDRDAMVTVADAIAVPLTLESSHLTIKEFYAKHPGVAYWYENKLWLAIVGIVVAFGVSYLVLSWLMYAIGVPSVLTLPF